MKFDRSIACVSAAALLSGCAWLQALTFSRAEGSGADAGDIELFVIGNFPKGSGESATEPYSWGESVPAFMDAVKLAGCESHKGSAPPAVTTPSGTVGALVLPAAAVGLVATVIETAAKLVIDRLEGKIEEIVASAHTPYSLTKPISSAALQGGTCILFVRHMPKSTQTPKSDKTPAPPAPPALLALLQIKHIATGSSSAKAATFTPVYVAARNAVAVTKKVDPDLAKIDIAIGVSLKAISLADAQVPALGPTGAVSMSVAGVEIGKPGGPRAPTDAEPITLREMGKPRCDTAADKCAASDLLPYPAGDQLLSLTVAIVEQGKTGFDDKAAQAQLAVLRESLGPALSEAFKARYGK